MCKKRSVPSTHVYSFKCSIFGESFFIPCGQFQQDNLRFTLAVKLCIEMKLKICMVKIFCLPQISVTDNLVDRRTHSPTILGDNGKISGLAAALDEGGCRH